jgi:hypothetical protein
MIPLISDPKLIYKAIQEIQVIVGGLSFIESSFGLAEHRRIDTRTVPTCYQGEDLDEIEVSPTDVMKSFCFWDVIDPGTARYGDGQEVVKSRYSNLTYNVAFIFYTFDIRRLALANDIRSSKAIIIQNLLKTFERGLMTAQSDFIITDIYDRKIEDVYRGFDVQSITQPAYGVRIDGALSFDEACTVVPGP